MAIFRSSSSSDRLEDGDNNSGEVPTEHMDDPSRGDLTEDRYYPSGDRDYQSEVEDDPSGEDLSEVGVDPAGPNRAEDQGDSG